jgi:hypothetical protein
MLVSVHDDNVTGDLAVAANRDRLSRHDLRVSIEVCAVSDADNRISPAFEAHSAEKGTIPDLDAATVVLHPYTVTRPAF